MASIKKLFSPKGNTFYDLFEAVADNSVEISRLFQQLVYNTEPVLPVELLDKIEDFEHQNDKLTHQIFIQLGRNFITPFDREDIHDLASALDDIADFTWGAARQLRNQNLTSPGDTTIVFATQHHNHTKLLAEAVRQLRNTASFPGLGLLLRDLHKNVRRSGDIVDDALVRIFADGKDVRRVITLVDHYELLHNILEKTSSVIKKMEVIVVKYG